jgi:hypothetical protein
MSKYEEAIGCDLMISDQARFTITDGLVVSESQAVVDPTVSAAVRTS